MTYKSANILLSNSSYLMMNLLMDCVKPELDGAVIMNFISNPHHILHTSVLPFWLSTCAEYNHTDTPRSFNCPLLRHTSHLLPARMSSVEDAVAFLKNACNNDIPRELEMQLKSGNMRISLQSKAKTNLIENSNKKPPGPPESKQMIGNLPKSSFSIKTHQLQ